MSSFVTLSGHSGSINIKSEPGPYEKDRLRITIHDRSTSPLVANITLYELQEILREHESRKRQKDWRTGELHP